MKRYFLLALILSVTYIFCMEEKEIYGRTQEELIDELEDICKNSLLNVCQSLSLEYAIWREDLKTIEGVLREDVAIDKLLLQEFGGCTPLMLACLSGSKKIVEFLLSKGTDTNKANSRGLTALMIAAKKGYKELVKLLLANGAIVNAVSFKQTALDFAAKNGHKDIVELFLEAKANFLSVEYPWDAMLTVNPHISSVEKNALMCAIKNGHANVVELFLKRGIHLGDWDEEGTNFPFPIAIENEGERDYSKKEADQLIKLCSHHEVLLYLKDPLSYAQSILNPTPIMLAASGYNELVIVVLLLVRGKSNITVQSDPTAYIWIARARERIIIRLRGIVESSKLFKELLLHPHTQLSLEQVQSYLEDTSILAPLILVTEHGVKLMRAKDFSEDMFHDPEIDALVQELSKNPEVQLYLKDPSRYVQSKRITAVLMLACIFGHTEVISLFRDCPVECLNARDCYGYTAFDYALQYNLNSAATLINCFGIKLEGLNGKGKELLEMAVENGSLNLVNALLGVGVQPTIGLAQKARELGYLKIMHRLLFSALAYPPEHQKYPQIGIMSGLFK